MGSIVTIVNQTARPLVLNMAPVTDNAVHLPPYGRQNVLEEELGAYEVQGALKALPPRLVVVAGPQLNASTPAAEAVSQDTKTDSATASDTVEQPATSSKRGK